MTAPKERLSKSDRKYRNQRQLIIQAAKRLFELKEYDDVSMEDIADEAAVSKQTLYNYFSSKETIYFGIGIADFMNLMESSEAAARSGSTGREQVLNLSENFFVSLKDDPLNTEIARRFTVTNNQMNGIANITLQKRAKKSSKDIEKKRSLEDLLADYLQKLRDFEQIWNTAIKKGVKDGSIISKLSPEQLFQYIGVIIWGTVDQMKLRTIPLERVKLDDSRMLEVTLEVIDGLLGK